MSSSTRVSVPDTWTQSRASAASAPRLESEKLACVRCCADIRVGSWCNSCRQQMVDLGRARGWLSVRIADTTANGDNCDCGRPMPPRMRACSRCAWLDRDSDPRASRALVLSCLRSQRYSTVADVVRATGLVHRTAVDALTSLGLAGRVTRVAEELDADSNVFRGGGFQYLYRLVD